MKKILTKVLVAAMMCVCIFSAGCGTGKTAKEVLKICNDFLNSFEEIKAGVKSDYIYPLEEAQAAAVSVAGTDRSNINMEYSEYFDFNFEQSAKKSISDSISGVVGGDTGNVGGTFFAPRTLYWMSSDLITGFKVYVDCFEDNKFKLDTTYMYYNDKPSYEREEYFKISYENDKVYIYEQVDSGGTTYYTVYIIETEGADWKNIERRCVGFNDADEVVNYNYFYLQKATNENRLFDMNSVVTWDVSGAHIRAYDLNEIAQKMVIFDTAFNVDTAQGCIKDVKDFMLGLDFESFVNVLDLENATTVSVAE